MLRNGHTLLASLTTFRPWDHLSTTRFPDDHIPGRAAPLISYAANPLHRKNAARSPLTAGSRGNDAAGLGPEHS